MSEAKDPAIKLFGKTIPVPEILPGSNGAPASSSGDVVVDDSVDASSTNSSRESHTNTDAQEKDFDKVWFWGLKIFYFECDRLFEMWKELMGWFWFGSGIEDSVDLVFWLVL